MSNLPAILLLIAISVLLLVGQLTKDHWGKLFTGKPAQVQTVPGGLDPI